MILERAGFEFMIYRYMAEQINRQRLHLFLGWCRDCDWQLTSPGSTTISLSLPSTIHSSTVPELAVTEFSQSHSIKKIESSIFGLEPSHDRC